MQIRENISLHHYNSFGIAATAKYFAIVTSVQELKDILSHTKRSTATATLILGGGSNILLTKDFNGLVIKNEIGGIDIVNEDDEHIYVKAGAGVNWHELVMFCVENDYAGMENLSLIPGSVGASPLQNIGAYGVELKDVFYEAEAYHIADEISKKFSLEECEFGYRESVFKHQYKGEFVITNVTYRLRKKPVFNTNYGALQKELEDMGVKDLTIQAISQAVISIRSSKLPDPKAIGNAGSFFKNPQVDKRQFVQFQKDYPGIPHYPFNNDYVKVPAGWLIEQCGWKGFRKGDAGCYAKQALVLVNYGKASGKEIYALSEEILQSVKAKFNIELKREVNII